MKKSNQQSRSDWGGKRAGAGALLGNTNAVKHGERSRQAFFTLAGAENSPPLVSLRASNLAIAECAGELLRIEPHPHTEAWRELMLLDGIMWQHTRRMFSLALNTSRQEVALAKLQLAEMKAARRSVGNK